MGGPIGRRLAGRVAAPPGRGLYRSPQRRMNDPFNAGWANQEHSAMVI